MASNKRKWEIPAYPARVADPTGAGDAFRSGLVKGLLLGAELDVVGRIAGLAATYVVEQIGTQEHSYSPDQFVARFDLSFPDFVGALSVADLQRGI